MSSNPPPKPPKKPSRPAFFIPTLTGPRRRDSGHQNAVPPPFPLFNRTLSANTDRSGGFRGLRSIGRKSYTLSSTNSAYSRYSLATFARSTEYKPRTQLSDLESVFSTPEVVIAKETPFHVNLEAAERRDQTIQSKENPKRYAKIYMFSLGIAYSTRDALFTWEAQEYVNVLLQAELHSNDFISRVPEYFPRQGVKSKNLPKPAHPMKKGFTFVQYAPMVFKRLRFLHGISERQFREEMVNHKDLIEFQTTSKSKSFFYHTFRGSFIVKSQTAFETDVLMEMLPGYYHFMLTNPNSMLPRFLGLYRVDYRGRKTYFVVMKSVYSQSVRNKKKIHKVFDLKGSSVGRRTNDPNKVQKDKNLKEEIQERKMTLVNFSSDTDLFQQQIVKDTEFLRKYNIMDYSFLLAVHDPRIEGSRGRGGANRQGRTFDPDRMSFVPEAPERNNRMTMTSTILRSLPTSEMVSDVPSAMSVVGLQINDTYNSTGVQKPVFANYKCKVGQVHYQYFVGIIDILQTYTWKKKLETMFKGLKYNRKKISAVPAKLYQKRFLDFLFEDVIEDIERNI